MYYLPAVLLKSEMKVTSESLNQSAVGTSTNYKIITIVTMITRILTLN